ncbi:(deoxy)nucleoside triphosphate pyrophosphohydrolase [Catenisphaera adipataccumulans]|uniref:8-oxo-dGTP diphosphatase n=1 Tax=Catenisphaera adipataccumulans TaxID=700500 RepID=A0A7W8CYS3_9FIRM|nr:NUDIX domain-containing protein [Catenisphaera adipataccumulans]MBB5183856.1 8-oxo-dGTP diphosphatase [Catenisphaera adipataccumulans]
MLDVVCGALIIDGKVLIAKRSHGASIGKFEFPGGKVEPGETRKEALIREMKEECQIDIEQVEFLQESVDENQNVHLTCFTCTAKEKPTKLLVHSEYIWTTPDHIYDHDFFETDRSLVEKLQERWSCLNEPKKPKS